MARLPIPQGDDDVWGVILNDFLSVAHDTDGTLKTHAHTAANISDFATAADARITAQKGVASGIASLDGTTKLPIAQIPTGTTSTTVSLGNHAHTAANISDFATAADARITTQKGAANGIATLGADSKIPSAQLPDATVSYASRLIGEIMSWPSDTLPSGWLLCNGSAISRTTYADLFTAVGTTYGVGDGSTTFNLPDFRGRSPMGYDTSQTEFNTLGKVGGSKTHTLTESEMPSHTHVQNSHNHTQNSHNHTQNSHNHAQDAHNHTQNAHGHTNWRATGYAVGGSSYGLWPSNTGDPVLDGTVTAIATNQAATATNQAATATNIATTATNIATTATNQTTGGGAAHNNLQPYQVTNWIIKALFTGGEVGPSNHIHEAADITSGVLAESTIPTTILPPTGSINMWVTATPPTGWLLCEGQTVSRTTYATLFGILGTTYGAGDGSTTFTLPNMKGRVAAGFDSGDASFSTMGQTGGAKTHTLTESEMPSHTHIQNSHNHTQNSHNHTQNSHNHTQDSHGHTQAAHTHSLTVGGVAAVGSTASSLVNTGSTTYVASGGVNNILAANATPAITDTTATNQATTATNIATTATNIATTATNQSTGGGAAHNNLQPYIVMRYIIKT